ncbi:MAG: metallophosphoesterase [Planctomycetota bacterium]
MSDYRKVKEALSKSLAKSRETRESHEVENLNLVVFSDLHRGKGNGADDFRKCERAYRSALSYYDQLKSRLILLGDIEELWETSIKKTVRHYRQLLEVEKKFVNDGRYTRLIGNHDETLANPKVFKTLSPFVNGVQPIDALNIEVKHQGDLLGELFFAHGHQGKHYSKLDKWAVRYLWAGFQKLTGLGSSWPSANYEIRNRHEKAMYEWSIDHQAPLIFICGHTHRPVFMSSAQKQFLIKEIEQMRRSNAPAKDIAEATARLNWILLDPDKNSELSQDTSKPSYFNSGCCSFADGDITGIEISDGCIRLIKWGESGGRLKRIELHESRLADVFAGCRD